MKAAMSDGISFAIPIDLVKSIMKQLREHGFVKRLVMEGVMDGRKWM
jgi:S1-C subfamily serine protease